MHFIKNKQPTLKMKWSVLGNDGCEERALKFTTKKSKPVPVQIAEHLPDDSVSCPDEESRPTDTIRVGDRLRLELQSDMDGYLTLFDFGTSGRFTKLFPCKELSTIDNGIKAGKTYAAPGELLPIPDFRVSGPTTAESGRMERLLVIVTRDPVELAESAILGMDTSFAARGGFAAVEEAVSSLFDIPDGEWTYGLLETEVVQ